MAEDQMTLQQFGAQVKSKYPAYASKSDEEVGQAMLKKYPQYQSRIKGPGFWASYDAAVAPFVTPTPHKMPHSAADVGREAVTTLSNIGANGLGVVLHPLNTVGGILKSAVRQSPPVALYEDLTKGTDANKELAEQIVNKPLETGEAMAGQAAVLGGGEEAVGAIPKAAGGVARFVTKTTPEVTKNLAKETSEANAAATTKAAEETATQQTKHAEDVAKAEDKRKVDLKRHFEKTQEAKATRGEHRGPLGEEHELTPTEKVSRKEAINRGVERLDTEVRSDLEKTEEKVNAEANRRYNDLRKVLKDEVADPYQPVDEEGHANGEPVTMTEHLYDVANAPLRGTETETPIIRSLGKRTEQGDVELTYNDLQGYREEVGRELRRGSLPPDVFTAYKNLIGAIDDAMGKIAERNGLKPQQDAARAYYRQYAETFLDRDAVARRALDSKERGGVAKAYQGKDQSGIEQIARFDPQVAQRLNNLRGYQGEAKALPSKPGKLTTLPKLAPKPPTPEAPAPVQPELKTIGPQEVQQAKLKSLTEKGIENVRAQGRKWVSRGVGMYALWDAFHGRWGNLPTDLAFGAAGYGATEAFARLLERPDIQQMLTRPTDADLAQIPPELRGNLGPMLDAAKAKGIKVDPRLYAIGGASQKKRVAALLQPQ